MPAATSFPLVIPTESRGSVTTEGERRNPEDVSLIMLIQGVLSKYCGQSSEMRVIHGNEVGPTKPIRVDGNGEFGEKYHTAIALLRDQKLRAVVFGPDTHHAKSFLSLFAPDRVLSADGIWRVRDCQPARKSTSIYCREFWIMEAAQRWAEIALHPVIEIMRHTHAQISVKTRPMSHGIGEH